MANKYITTIKKLAKMKALDAETAEKLLVANAEDGGKGSGNFGHKGRPGKVGGSSAEGGSGGSESSGESKPIAPKDLKVGQEIRINRSNGKGGIETEIFRRSKTGEFEHEVRTPTLGNLGTSQVNENYINQVLSKSKPEEISYIGAPEETGNMKEPYSSFGQEKHGSLKRDAKASDQMLSDYKKAMSENPTPEQAESFLNEMKPGQAFRWNEPGKKKTYDWAIKNADGSFTFTSREDGSQTKYDAKTLAKDLASGDAAATLGDFSVPEAGASERDAYWSAKRQFANLSPTPADTYTGKRVTRMESVENCEKRAQGASYPKEEGNASKEYTTVQRDGNGVITSAGKPVGVLTNGSGVTGIDRGDISNPNPDKLIYNTLGEHCVEDANGNLVLTPEREALHQEIIGKLFEKANKPADGKKVATFLGGGSAAGKGTIQGEGSGVDFPSKYDSPVIDADKLKESLPEYVDTAFSDDHEQAASFAHEESSSLAKRAMQAAMANGYSYTLDGTGDGSVKSMKKKIDEARANGYEVNGVYVTCPTEKAVERSIKRSKTDKYNRLVKPEVVREIHQKVSKLFPEIAPEMDKCDLYDTDQGGKPVLIATCKRGGPIQVINQKLYDAFLAKANE